MQKENFSPLCKSGRWVILESGRGRLAFALAMNREMLQLCRQAALLYDNGSRRAARQLFRWILKWHLPPGLRLQLYFMTTVEIAMLARCLAFPERAEPALFTAEDLKQAEERLRKK